MKTWGLDIGSSGIKAVELTRTWKGFRATRYGFRPIHDGKKEEFLSEKLRGLRGIFPEGEKGEGLTMAVPSQRTMVHRVLLPFRERKKNLRVVKFETEPLLPFPIDQVVVDFYAGKEKGEGEEALTFAVLKEDLNGPLALMQEARLDPESIIPESIALLWVMKHLAKEVNGGTKALLDLGHEKTTLTIWSGGALVLVRAIPIAGAAVSRALEQKLKITPAEAAGLKEKGLIDPAGQAAVSDVFIRLADEVKRTIISYESGPEGKAVEKIFLTGGSAGLTGIEKSLGGLLGKPAAVLHLEESSPFLLRDIPREYHHALTVALGAALWGSWPGEMNFRQEEFVSSKKVKKERSRITLLLSYAVILSLLGIAAFSTDLYLKEKRYRDLKAEIRKEFLQARPGIKKVVNEMQQMKGFVQEERARVDALGGLSKAGFPLEILHELSAMTDPAWKVKVTELVIDPETLELNGEADSFDTVNRLKAKLDRSSFFKDVQLKTARASTIENVIEFKLQMKRGL